MKLIKWPHLQPILAEVADLGNFTGASSNYCFPTTAHSHDAHRKIFLPALPNLRLHFQPSV